MDKSKIFRVLGLIGLFLSLFIYIREPSFPTPDKLLVVLLLAGLAYGKAVEIFKRFVPFIGLLFVYESFRGVADYLNKNIHYTFMADFDRLLGFGVLPTAWLQQHLWSGQVKWYDFELYIFYMLHFVLPVALAVLIWIKRPKHYWRYVTAFVILSFAGFLTYIVYPAAPPWMASNNGYIEHIDRVSSSVWHSLGVHDFPSVYNEISPNAVAAVPSLHAAYSVLFCVFFFVLFKKSRWKWLTLIYPFSIIFGTVYMGEHYIFDALAGAIYAFVAYFVSKPVDNYIQKTYKKFAQKLR